MIRFCSAKKKKKVNKRKITLATEEEKKKQKAMKRIVKLSAGFVALSAAYVATLRSSDLKGRDRIVVALVSALDSIQGSTRGSRKKTRSTEIFLFFRIDRERGGENFKKKKKQRFAL